VATSIRVLILEDRPEDAELMVHALRRSYFEPEWRRVDDESEYSTQLAWPPDIILADYSMPKLDAPRALELLRRLDLDIPFIVVSGAIGEDTAVAMMREGATDYLLKDRLTRLGPAVRRALEETQLRDEIRQAEQALRTSEVRFSSFMNNSPALAFIKDWENRILYINNTCQQMWGVTLAECLGKNNYELWPDEVAERLTSNDREVLERDESSQIVERVLLRSGRTVEMLTFRFPFADGDGQALLGGVSIDISEQVRAQKALSSALAIKELLLKEVHHRVKNNLQIISSLLTMQAESIQDPAARQAFQDSQERVRCMALIHERLNRDDEPDQLDFRDYVETLARDLFYSYGVDSNRIRLRFELEPVSLSLNQAIPCGLVLNELLTNSLKYAFPGERQGEILVKLSCGNDELVKLTVADDGVGLAADFDWQKSQSLGLRIMSILGHQLDGTVERGAGPGTAFSLGFPRAVPPEAGGDAAEVTASREAQPSARKPSGSISNNKIGQTA
jgi:PAS domain S-box-containing protein